MTDAIRLARFFHETYERLAPNYGYETREASRKPWDAVPEQNKRLMIAVCREVIDNFGNPKKAAADAIRLALKVCEEEILACIGIDGYPVNSADQTDIDARRIKRKIIAAAKQAGIEVTE